MKFQYIDLLRYAENNPGNEIYYHPEKTWWTHSLEDLKQSSEMAVMFIKGNAEEMLKDETVDQETKDKVKDHVSKLEDPDYKIVLCPDGCPMYKVNIIKFIVDNTKNQQRLGKHGLLALMAAHHQNCEGIITKDWEDLNPIVEAWIESTGCTDAVVIDRKMEAMNLVASIGKRYREKNFSGQPLQIVRAGTKPHRNDPCPCNSGKKFKNCHGNL